MSKFLNFDPDFPDDFPTWAFIKRKSCDMNTVKRHLNGNYAIEHQELGSVGVELWATHAHEK